MTYVKWIVGLWLALFVFTFLQYTLPSRDIVHIVGTDVKRMDIGNSWRSWFWASVDAGTETKSTRDVRFINVELPNGEPYVYRNEDTEWSWPPYLKFDSGNLTAQAQSLAKREKVWVAVTHYGWRIKIFTIFPNAVKIVEVSGPDAFLIPWFNIIFFVVLAVIVYFIFRAIRAFKAKRIDPILEDIDEMVDGVSDSAERTQTQARAVGSGLWASFSAWFHRWFGKAP